MVAVEFLGRLGEAVAELGLVGHVQADQDRLIGAFDGLGVGVVEAVEEGRGRPPPGGLEVELRLPLRDPEQADQADLLVLADGPAEELELPARPAADVEDPVRPGPLVHHDQPPVVGRRLLAEWTPRRSSPLASAEAAKARTV